MIHQRVNELSVAIPLQPAVRPLPHDDMLRLHVHHAIAFKFELVRGQAGRAGEERRPRLGAEVPPVGNFSKVEAFDPAVQNDVLAQDIQFDAGMPRQLGRDFTFRPARLP